ncbi:MAG: T9SS type A sorting domain-containing protein, partial [Ignavibacteriaceae bacterium]|nr:T9SS type A sorting domain-containing protein [Ignavibacteriaceae bacterium]
TSGNSSGAVSLLTYVAEVLNGTETTDIWGYKNNVMPTDGSNWIPVWPLPESADMQYTNTALKTAATDGKPVGDYSWFGIPTAVKETSAQNPYSFSLSNAYPNPFNPTTTIKFGIAKNENVKLVVFNLLGQKVKTLMNGDMKAGSYSATWNGKDEFGNSVASGIYFYRLESQSFNSTKKMILMK